MKSITTCVACLLTACACAGAAAGAAETPRYATAKEWQEKVRPKVIDFFEKNVYGKMPPRPAKVEFVLDEQGDDALGGIARRRQYRIVSTDACIAPRALIISAATNDRSSPPRASRMTWERANPIFGLFGKSVGWHLKKGPHSITHEDWRFFMDYARNELKW